MLTSKLLTNSLKPRLNQNVAGNLFTNTTRTTTTKLAVTTRCYSSSTSSTPSSSSSSSSPTTTTTTRKSQEPLKWSRVSAAAAEKPSEKIETSKVLDLLKSQSNHYIVVRMHGTQKYILTPQDQLTVERLKDANVGDVIRFTRIVEVGSRDYTLRYNGNSSLKGFSPSIVECQATVEEHFQGPLVTVHRSRRRHRYHRTVQQRHNYTRLRIGDIIIGNNQSQSS